MSLQPKTIGVYLPPHKRRLVEAEERQQAESSEDDVIFQRQYWDALKRSICTAVNRATPGNIRQSAFVCLRENLIRGRGLLCATLMRQQRNNPQFTPVFAGFVSVINTKLPQVGELLLKRLVMNYKRMLRRRDAGGMKSTAIFLANLTNQQVQNELLVLKLLATLLCMNDVPSDTEMDIAVAVIRVVYDMLSIQVPEAMLYIMNPLRKLFESRKLSARGHKLVSRLLADIRSKPPSRPGVSSSVKMPWITDPVYRVLADGDEPHTHNIDLDEIYEVQRSLDIFRHDEEFTKHEDEYDSLRVKMLGIEFAHLLEDDDDLVTEENDEQDTGRNNIHQQPEESGKRSREEDLPERSFTNEQVALRRRVYLIFQSSSGAQEIAHKLLRDFGLGEDLHEIVWMTLDMALRERSFSRTYAQTAELLSRASLRYAHEFQKQLRSRYNELDEMDARAVGVLARFEAHLLSHNAIRWSSCLDILVLSKEGTTPASRNFIKILFQQLGSLMGVAKLTERLEEADNARALRGVFGLESAEQMAFVVNFFELISESGVNLTPLIAGLRGKLEKMTF